MCDNVIKPSILAHEMNTPLPPPNEESTKMLISADKKNDDALIGSHGPFQTGISGNAKYDNEGNISLDMHVDDASSSGDDDDDDDEEAGSQARGATKKAPEGATSVLHVPQRYTKSGRKRSIPFPVRLMTVLNDPKFHHIIDWLPSGKSFVIFKPKVFATDILPSTFKSAKYSSFTRKLHRWGFVRHFRGGESGAFFHPDFQKGRLDMAEAMTCCQQQKETAPKKKAQKNKLNDNKSQPASADPSTTGLSSTIRKSGIANFRNVMGANSSATAALQQNQAQLLSRVGSAAAATGSTPTMRLPMLTTNQSDGIASDVTNALQAYSSHSLPGVVASGRNTLNQYTGMIGAAGNLNRQDLRYPAMSLDTVTSSDLVAQQQLIMKAQLDAAIKEELARIEYARLTKERLATANAVHRYNAMLQQQRNNTGDILLGGALQSGSDGMLGNLSSSSLLRRSDRSVASSSLLGSNDRTTASLAPVLSQLSRAELEHYAMAMSTRNRYDSEQQLPTSPPFGAGATFRGPQRRSNPF